MTKEIESVALDFNDNNLENSFENLNSSPYDIKKIEDVGVSELELLKKSSSMVETMDLDDYVDEIEDSNETSSRKPFLHQTIPDTLSYLREDYNTDSNLKAIGMKLIDTKARIEASEVTSILAVGEGITNFVEGVGDVVITLGGSIASLGAGLVDIGEGLFTGDWKFDKAQSIFDDTMSVVAYDWSSTVFDAIYNTKLISDINTNAYNPFKRGEFVYETIGSVTELTCAVVTGGAISGLGLFGVGSGLATSVMYGANVVGEQYEGTAQKFIKDGSKASDNLGGVVGNLVVDTAIGAIEGGAFYLTYGNGWKNAFGNRVEKTTLNKCILQGSKSIIKDIINYETGDLKLEEGETVVGKIIWNAVVNAGNQFAYDKVIKPKIVDPVSVKMNTISSTAKVSDSSGTDDFSIKNSTGNSSLDLIKGSVSKNIGVDKNVILKEKNFHLNIDGEAFVNKTKSTVGKSPIKTIFKSPESVKNFVKNILSILKKNL